MNICDKFLVIHGAFWNGGLHFRSFSILSGDLANGVFSYLCVLSLGVFSKPVIHDTTLELRKSSTIDNNNIG